MKADSVCLVTYLSTYMGASGVDAVVKMGQLANADDEVMVCVSAAAALGDYHRRTNRAPMTIAEMRQEIERMTETK